MFRSSVRFLAATLIATLVWGSSVQAGPVSVRQVVLIFDRYGNPAKVELGQHPTTPQPTTTKISNAITSRIETKQSGIEDPVNGLQPQERISVITQDDFEGTICDCGEILVAGGGFPKWPLLFLGAIPLFFIHTGSKAPIPGSPPISIPLATPVGTPSVSPVPEQTSLLLLALGLLGLGIYLRRRREALSISERKRDAELIV